MNNNTNSYNVSFDILLLPIKFSGSFVYYRHFLEYASSIIEPINIINIVRYANTIIPKITSI